MENPNDYIIIPNPIYDVVFKYLMEDEESAKIILSTLINENIKHLFFEPLSHTEKIKESTEDKEIRLFHLDFTATIEKPDGSEELIMIELQKANETSDIFRFKRYISANFQKKQETEVLDWETQAIKKIQKPIRLLPIFILNFRIENEIDELIIKTQREKYGVFREKKLSKNNEFIDNLSYDIWVVQLPNLNKISPKEYENDLYKSKLYALLKLFDQQAVEPKSNRHRLRLFKKVFPNFLERVIKRLQAAGSENPELEDQMHAEDEYLRELIERANKIVFFKEKWEKTTEELKKERKKSLQKSQELEKERLESLQKSQELERERREREQERLESLQKSQELENAKKIILDLALRLKKSGMSSTEIQAMTGLSLDEIQNL